MKKSISFVFMVTALLSCTKNQNEGLVKTSSDDYSVDERTELISSYAQMLAASLDNSDLRKEIKKEACHMFDGDYDILAKENRSVRELMANSCIITRSQLSGFSI